MANSRVRRGRASQEVVAGWFRGNGWPDAQSRPASLSGDDVFGMPNLSIEVKASSRFNVLAALRQARANANGSLPLVIHRPDGMGLASIGEWVVSMRLEDATRLLVALRESDAVLRPVQTWPFTEVPDDAA